MEIDDCELEGATGIFVWYSKVFIERKNSIRFRWSLQTATKGKASEYMALREMAERVINGDWWGI